MTIDETFHVWIALYDPTLQSTLQKPFHFDIIGVWSRDVYPYAGENTNEG